MEFRRGRKLFDYQQETVDAIVAREKTTADTYIALTEPCGAGKTFIILGVIMTSPLPFMKFANLTGLCAADRNPIIKAFPSKRNLVLRPTVIMVARSVYSQWLRNICDFTSLRVFEVRDVMSARKLIDATNDGTINGYDVVLFKAGETKLHDHELIYPTPLHEDCKGYYGPERSVDLCDFFTKNVGPVFWARLVCDDVDVIRTSKLMRAMSVIFATGAVETGYSCESPTTRNLFDAFEKPARIKDVCFDSNGHMWSVLGHSVAMIRNVQKLYAIDWYLYAISNRDMERAAKIIGEAASDYSEIIDMIRNDAIITAAKTLGIDVASPAALLANVLGKQRTDYEVACARKSLMQIILEMRIADPDAEELELKNTKEIEGIIKVAEKELRAEAAGPFAINDLLKQNPATLKDRIARLDSCIVTIQKSFARISDNISEQSCAICCEPLSGENVTIAKCCGYITCAGCCIDGCGFRSANGRLEGRCMHCRQPLNLRKDVVMIQSSVDVVSLVQEATKASQNAQTLLSAEYQSAKDESGVDLKKRIAAMHNAEQHVNKTIKIQSKTEFIVNMIRDNIANCTGFKKFVDEPLKGFDILVGDELAAPPGGRKKFFVCSSFDESLNTISAALFDAYIPHEILRGTVGEIDNSLDRFRNEVDVLLVNITGTYAGLDLQCITDVVLFSKNDRPRIGQVIGRAARLGRTSTLTVHTIEYDNS